MTSQLHPVDRIRTHVLAELAPFMHEWEHYAQSMSAQDCVDEAQLVRLAGLTQITRGMVRLLVLPLSEVCALSMEALLTYSLCGEACYNARLHALMQHGCRSLYDVFALYVHNANPSSEQLDSLRCKLFELSRLLLQEVEETVQDRNDAPCIVYPLRRIDSYDPAPLRVRGFDLLRVELEGLNMYMLDYAWDDVLERGSGVGALLGFLARNGHVFDVRSVQDRTEAVGGLLRLVFASALDQDFVEAVTRIPAGHVHTIHFAQIKNYEACWQASRPVEAKAQTAASLQRLDELVADYDAAMIKLFSTARAEHGEALHPSADDDNLAGW